ncbi:MAG: hypothetical protein ACK5AO_02085 [bacterium]
MSEDLDQAKENAEKEELRNCEEEDRVFNLERINEVKAGVYAIENQRDVKGCLVEFEEFLKSTYIN